MAFDEQLPAASAQNPQILPRPPDSPLPRAQIRPPLSLQHWLSNSDSRDQALRRAHIEGGMSLTAIARELGLSSSRVSRLVARATQTLRSDDALPGVKGRT